MQPPDAPATRPAENNKPTPATDGAADAAAIRASIVGDWRPIKQIAKALGCCDRTVYNLVVRHKIPYLRVLNVRHARPADIHAALLREQVHAPARGRGRPRRGA